MQPDAKQSHGLGIQQTKLEAMKGKSKDAGYSNSSVGGPADMNVLTNKRYSYHAVARILHIVTAELL